MFTYQIRHETLQKIRVGIFLGIQTRINIPPTPVVGAQLSWYYWKYLIKSDDTVVNIGSNTWGNIPSCAGLYYLTLTAANTNKLGPLVLYINDAALSKPVLMYFEVVSKNVYDAKYGVTLLKVELEAQKF